MSEVREARLTLIAHVLACPECAASRDRVAAQGDTDELLEAVPEGRAAGEGGDDPRGGR